MATPLKGKRGCARVRFRGAAGEPGQAALCQPGALPDDELLFTVGITKYPQGRAALSVLQVHSHALGAFADSRRLRSTCPVTRVFLGRT